MDSPTSSDSVSFDASPDHATLPTLYRDRSFWGMSVTQFLGAFNDNLFKFLILLLATPTAAAVAADEEAKDLQAEAMIVFAAAFLLFSGLAGFLADKISKRTIIVGAKVAEILVMLAGLIGFYYFETIGLTGMMVILFFMGLQSAFFGPAKYGILPEMVRENDLPRAPFWRLSSAPPRRADCCLCWEQKRYGLLRLSALESQSSAHSLRYRFAKYPSPIHRCTSVGERSASREILCSY